MCCGKHVSEATPCSSSDVHKMREYRRGELDRLHQLQETPRFHPDRARTVKFAVTIDCEMGTARSGDSELIRLSAVDYLTGEVLINNLVKPDQPMLHLNTKWSGVTFDQMNEAVRKRTTLKGKVSNVPVRITCKACTDLVHQPLGWSKEIAVEIRRARHSPHRTWCS